MFDIWKQHFHPHEDNDHHPHAYRKASAVALAGVVGCILVLSALQTRCVRQSDQFASSVLPSVLVDLTNEDRREHNRDRLRFNSTLTKAAQMKANHMAENGYFTHDSPSGVTPWYWFREVGYSYREAGENLAVDFTDSKHLTDAWMDSRLHRENILEEDFTEIGIATARGQYKGRQSVFVVQLFAQPDDKELAQRRSGKVGNRVSQQASIGTQQQGIVSQGTTGDEKASGTTISSSASSARLTTVELASQLHSKVRKIQSNLASSSADQRVATNTYQATEQTQATETTFVRGQSSVAAGSTKEAGSVQHLLSQPRLVFHTLSITLIALVLLALLTSVIVELKKHHIRLAGYSLMTIAALIAVFAFVHAALFTDPVIAGTFVL